MGKINRKRRGTVGGNVCGRLQRRKDVFGAERTRIVSVDYYGGVELFGLGDVFFFCWFFFGGKLPPKYILPICSGRLN